MVVAILVTDLYLDPTIRHEYELFTSLASLQDEVTSLVNLLLHKELNLVEEGRVRRRVGFSFDELLEVVHLLEKLDLELDPFVIIFEYLFTNCIVTIWRIVPKLVELFLIKVSKNAIVHTLNSCCSRAVIYKTDLSEISSWNQLVFDLVGLLHVVADRYLALPSRDEAKVAIMRVILLENDVLWQEKLRLNLIDEEFHHLFL